MKAILSAKYHIQHYCIFFCFQRVNLKIGKKSHVGLVFPSTPKNKKISRTWVFSGNHTFYFIFLKKHFQYSYLVEFLKTFTTAKKIKIFPCCKNGLFFSCFLFFTNFIFFYHTQKIGCGKSPSWITRGVSCISAVCYFHYTPYRPPVCN